MKYFVHKPHDDRQRNIVAAFKTANPKTAKEIKALGFSLKHISNGAFREVYKIKNTKLVVKIVEEMYCYELSEGCLEHHRDEIKWYTKIMTDKKYKLLSKYMPEIYYHNECISLVKEYENFFSDISYNKVWRRVEALGEVLTDLFNLILNKKSSWRDFNNSGNIGLDKDTDGLVLLDLGCFDAS